MANKKITDYAAGDRPRRGDLFEMAQNPASVPISRKIAIEQIIQPATELPPATANAMDDEFDGVVLDPKWTWITQGLATIVFNFSLARFDVNNVGGRSMRWITQAMPAGDWRVEAKMSTMTKPSSTVAGGPGTGFGNLHAAGLGIRRSSTANCYVSYLTNDGGWRTYSQRMSGNSFNSTSAFFDFLKPQQWYWLAIEKIGTNYLFSLSYDGVFFFQYAQEAEATWIVAGDQVGIVMDTVGGPPFCLMVEYFRRTA